MAEINIRRRIYDSRGCDAGYCYSKYQPLEKTNEGCLSVETWEYYNGGTRYGGKCYALCGIWIDEEDPIVASYLEEQEARLAAFCEKANKVGIAKALQETGAEKMNGTKRRGRPFGSLSSGPTGGGRKINIFIPSGLVPNLERAAQRDNLTAAQWVKNKVLTLLRLEGEAE